jgi:hypothetical protein
MDVLDFGKSPDCGNICKLEPGNAMSQPASQSTPGGPKDGTNPIPPILILSPEMDPKMNRSNTKPRVLSWVLTSQSKETA